MTGESFDRRKEDRDTRDTAVRADQKVDSHIQDCIKWREVVEKSFQSLKADLAAQGTDIKSLNNRVVLIIGGLIVVSKLLDWVAPALHKGAP